MKTLCRVFCQYYDENGKPKGGQEFTTRVDSDALMYAPEDLIKETFQKLIDDYYKDSPCKCTYLSHELVFNEPIELEGDFNETMDSLYMEAPEKYKH